MKQASHEYPDASHHCLVAGCRTLEQRSSTCYSWGDLEWHYTTHADLQLHGFSSARSASSLTASAQDESPGNLKEHGTDIIQIDGVQYLIQGRQ